MTKFESKSLLTILLGVAVLIQTSFALVCYDCKESLNVNCGATLVNPATIPTKTCTSPNSTCVTFANTFDNNSNLLIYICLIHFDL